MVDSIGIAGGWKDRWIQECMDGSRTPTANRSFPRPSRWSAVRGLERSASRVHGAHRYRRR